MKDVMKEFFKQPADYGRRPKENITRIDAHVSNVQNIYRILGAERLQAKIIFGKTVTKSFPATVSKAAKTIREYGETLLSRDPLYEYRGRSPHQTKKLSSRRTRKKKTANGGGSKRGGGSRRFLFTQLDNTLLHPGKITPLIYDA